MNKGQWMEECAELFERKADVNRSMAMDLAETAWENRSGDETPSEAVDDELSYWGD